MRLSRPLLAALVWAATLAAAQAQDFSPHFDTTGRGAYDLYRDAVRCSALLEGEAAALPVGDARAQAEQGVRDARGLALFMLGTGDVVDDAGLVLGPLHYGADLERARAAWEPVLRALDDASAARQAEAARCLRVYLSG